MPDKRITVLMIDDDIEDFMLISEAFAENGFDLDLRFLQNNTQISDFLCHRRLPAEAGNDADPALILLDLNMPGKDGFSILAELKTDPEFKNIPVVILTTSDLDKDKHRSLSLGAISYLIKPDSFEKLATMTRDLAQYWATTP